MQLRLAPLPTILFFHVFSLVQATNFTFTFGAATQCDNLPVSWSGGTPPFELQLIPVFGTPRTFSIPPASYSNGHGSFQAQIPFASGKNFLVSMSDSSGWGSGGTSDVLTVGPSVSNTSCNTTDPGVDFFFDLNTALQQCRPYTFSGYDNATQPVTIWAVIPAGESFILNPPVGPSSFDWIADVANKTSLVFIMTDSKGRKGGSSDVKQVGASDDASCLNAQSPVSVSNAPSGTSAPVSSTSSTSGPSGTGISSPEEGTPEKNSNTGAIVGGILAGLFALVAVAVLIVFMWRRRRRAGSYGGTGALPYGLSRRSRRLDSVDLDPPSTLGEGHSPLPVIQPYPYSSPGVLATVPGNGSVSYNPSPSAQDLLPQAQDAQYATSQISALHNPYSPSAQSQHSRNPSADSGPLSTRITSTSDPRSSVSSAARRKAAMAGMPSYKASARFILHTDLEEAQEEGEVIELPPQYSERRAPIPGLSSVSPSYAVPPPGAPPPNPLETDQGESSVRLQQPIEPGPPTPTSATSKVAGS